MDGGPPPACVLPDLGLAADTLSGCSDPGLEDGVRGLARFSNPVNVALGPSGIAYVVDFDSSRLRKIDPTGKVTTIYADPTFNRPFGIVLAPDGYLYIECDNDDHDGHSDTSGTIWKINPADPTDHTKLIELQARPRGLAVLGDGRIAITDYLTMVVNIIDPTSGIATLLAGSFGIVGHNNGNGASATFGQPWDLVLDHNGDLIVTEYENHILRKVTLNGDVTVYGGTPTVAGHQDGPLATALFNHPKGMTIDASGAIYITETGNHDVRKIANGMVTTIAGALEGGYRDDADPMAAAFYGVEGLDVSPDGKRLVVADGNEGDGSLFNHVRVITLP
jgi:DNA-binding beta-propeller fold protein YncE